MDMRQIVAENPVLAILRNVPSDSLTEYAGAIVDGGIHFFEVALNSRDALTQIRMLKNTFGDRAYIGAGTAITPERAKAAVEAGAQFLLSPSADEAVLDFCRRESIPILPGALTPSDVSLSVRYGYDLIKLFPAGDMPRGYIKSLKGPFDGTDYVAIGGVNADNAADFIRQGYIGVGLGSNLLPKEAVQRRDWAAAAAYAAKILANVNSAKNTKIGE